LSIPWGKKTKIKKNLNQAQRIFDSDHHGLENIKERIVEYLAVQQRANKLTGPILCLVGPPGVGKTSFGKSIARAVLDPGRGRTKTGYFWAISRDDRPWAGSDPPGVAYTYAPGRGGEHLITLLAGYSGIVQCDGYAAYKQLVGPKHDGQVTLAFCWAHWRRQFYDITRSGPAPIAEEALERIAKLFAIEQRIRGSSAGQRQAVRQAESKPIVEDLKTWLEQKLVAVSQKSTIADAIRYGFNQWDGLVRFLEDGRIEMDTNSVERAVRPIKLNRKNALFAGHDEGADNWACLASLIETAKLHRLNPQTYLADILTKLVNLWPMNKLDELLPWAWAKQNSENKLAA
jgi:transposase